VMDEPTNDLDIETLELLEEQLLNYKGTLLLVSHDREFLDNVVTSTFVLEGDGEVRCYPGGYEDYLRQRPAEDKGISKKEEGRSADDSISANEKQETRNKKLSFNEQRELNALPGKIEALEKEVAEIMACDPVKDYARYERLPAAQAELDALVERWADLEERRG